MSDNVSVPTLTFSAPSPTVAMRTYLSTHHLWAARHFAQLVQVIEEQHRGPSIFDIRQRAYAMGAVLSAVAFLEAAVNELFQDVADDNTSYTAPISAQARARLASYWRESNNRGSILEKYQVALGIIGCETLNTGVEPYQGAALLIKLRNLLVHFRPETVTAADEQNLERNLRGRFASNPLITTRGNPYFPDKCLGAGCSQWAVSVAKRFADERSGEWVFARTTNGLAGPMTDSRPLLPLPGHRRRGGAHDNR